MWAIMVIVLRGGREMWWTDSQSSDREEANRIAARVGGLVLPWSMRLLLLDNGLLKRSIRIH